MRMRIPTLSAAACTAVLLAAAPALAQAGDGIVEDGNEAVVDGTEPEVYGGAEDGAGIVDEGEGLAEERHEAGLTDDPADEQAQLTRDEPAEDGGYPVNDDDGIFEEDEGEVE